MATVKESPEGSTSWINNAFFCHTDDLKLYILTDPGSAHGNNLQKNPSVAVTILDTTQIPGNKRQGLQLIGTGKQIQDRNEELSALKRWNDRMRGRHGYENLEKMYLNEFESRMHEFVIDYIKIFDEKTFGDEVWVEVEVARSS